LFILKRQEERKEEKFKIIYGKTKYLLEATLNEKKGQTTHAGTL
jgi:hypothetical protein